MVYRRALLGLVALCAVLAPATAQADSYDPAGFYLQGSQLYVHENAGNAVILVQRSNTTVDAQIRYIVGGLGFPCGGAQCTGTKYDFTSVQGVLDFPPGVQSESFTVPIVDHGTYSLPRTIQASLFGPSPIGLASPSAAVLTILNDDPRPAVDASNPLGLPNAPSGNPLAQAPLYVDPGGAAAVAARQYPALNAISSQPGTARFGAFSWPDAGTAVSSYLASASVLQPGTVPMLATYRIVAGHCGNWSDPQADQSSYHNFIVNFAQGIGSYKAVLFLEMDSLITVGCLSPDGVTVRMNELHDAINILTANCPRLVIYLDAGAADALSAQQSAGLLQRAGIAQVQGFYLNATHFDWTSHEISYGETISQLTGGKHFVVNTGTNGRGPLVPPDIVHQGNEVLCNPAGRGLGPRPTTSTGYPNVDAFAWTTNPGESGGSCIPGAPPAGAYWPAYALSLVANANFSVDSQPAVTPSHTGNHHHRRHHHRRHHHHRHHHRRHHHR